MSLQKRRALLSAWGGNGNKEREEKVDRGFKMLNPYEERVGQVLNTSLFFLWGGFNTCENPGICSSLRYAWILKDEDIREEQAPRQIAHLMRDGRNRPARGGQRYYWFWIYTSVLLKDRYNNHIHWKMPSANDCPSVLHDEGMREEQGIPVPYS